MFDPTLINNRKAREPYTAQLIKSGDSEMVYLHFKYEIADSRRFSETTSQMPLNYVMVTETIRTSNIKLPFASGDKIKLYDGRTMTLRAVSYEHNDYKAMQGIDSRERVLLTLEGGGR